MAEVQGEVCGEVSVAPEGASPVAFLQIGVIPATIRIVYGGGDGKGTAVSVARSVFRALLTSANKL